VGALVVERRPMATMNKLGKKWRVRWFDGFKRATQMFETQAEANLFCRKMGYEERAVKQGVMRPNPRPMSFDELCTKWLDGPSKLKRSHSHDISIIDAHLRKSFGHMGLHEITQTHSDHFALDRAHLSSKTVHNHLTLLISMLNWAHSNWWLMEMPRLKKPKVKMLGKDFRFIATKEEIRNFLTVAARYGDHVHLMYSMALCTGMRAGELAGLRWEKLDLRNRLILVDKSYDGPTKSGEPRHVPIVDDLLTLVEAFKFRESSGLVFPNSAGNMRQPSDRVFQETFGSVLSNIGYEKKVRRGKSRFNLVFHDLRHTFASHWMMDGGDIFKLQRILGHQSIQMTMRYAHLAPNAFRDDYHRLGDLLGGAVIPLPKIHLVN